MPRHKPGNWVTIKQRTQKIFRGKGKDVKKGNILYLMKAAGKKGRQQ